MKRSRMKSSAPSRGNVLDADDKKIEREAELSIAKCSDGTSVTPDPVCTHPYDNKSAMKV
jgi:hypothetical protein